ncbi:hypothetical protein PIROE2DRAFT_20660 [Piromyces sp. E2]|nr:hypothetical protein PIROE2DRAFT_20660 [Piromyces sp. E2]|eukprot:OUM63520.1 hypothetical protein PIROE2DRAFT_20660 [Piromyces sp. E2]
MSNLSFDTNTPPPSPLFEKTKIKKINEVSSSLSSIIKQSSQLENEKGQPIIIKHDEQRKLTDKDISPNRKNIPLPFQQQTINNKPPLYNSTRTNLTLNPGEKKGIFLLKNKGLKLNSSFIDTNATIIQSKYPGMIVGSMPNLNEVNSVKQSHLTIPTNLNENKQPLFPETNYHTKQHHHHHHHHHHHKKTKEKRWGGGGGRSITLSHDGSEFIHKHNDNIIDPKEYEKTATAKSKNIDIVVTEEKEDYSNIHPLSLILENLTCYPSYHSYSNSNDKKINKNANPDLLSLKKDDAVAIQHFFPDGWAFGEKNSDGDNFNKEVNIYSEGNPHHRSNSLGNQDLSFTSPIPIPSASVSINYENSLSSSYLSSSTLSNNHSSSSLTSTSSSLSSSSFDSNQALFSPPIAINTEYNPNNPFIANYKNRNYWIPESFSPQSAPTLMNYKNEKSFLTTKKSSLFITTTNNNSDINTTNSNDNTTTNLTNTKIENENKLKEKSPQKTDEDNIDKITYDLSLLTLNEKTEKREGGNIPKDTSSSTTVPDSKEDSKEIELPNVKPKIDTSSSTIKGIIIKPIISPSSSYEKALPIFPKQIEDDSRDELPIATVPQSKTDNALPVSATLPIASGNSNELPLLSARPRRRRQRKDISDCNEFLKNRLLDPTLPLPIRKRYQYYIDNNL